MPPVYSLTCRIEECPKPVFAYATNLCSSHHRRLKRYGDPVLKPPCSVDDCANETAHNGFCAAHYHRMRRHGDPLAPVNDVFRPPTAPEPGFRWCSQCREQMPQDEFWADSRGPDGLSRYCRECALDRHVEQLYNLTPEGYRSLFDKQGGVCAVCHKPETATHQNGRVRRLSVDHDHACCPGKSSCGHCIRGLLCSRCNAVLGYVDDASEMLLALAAYVKDHENGRRR